MHRIAGVSLKGKRVKGLSWQALLVKSFQENTEEPRKWMSSFCKLQSFASVGKTKVPDGLMIMLSFFKHLLQEPGKTMAIKDIKTAVKSRLSTTNSASTVDSALNCLKEDNFIEMHDSKKVSLSVFDEVNLKEASIEKKECLKILSDVFTLLEDYKSTIPSKFRAVISFCDDVGIGKWVKTSVLSLDKYDEYVKSLDDEKEAESEKDWTQKKVNQKTKEWVALFATIKADDLEVMKEEYNYKMK